MKYLILAVTLTTSLFANTYSCKGADGSGNGISVEAQVGAKFIYLSLGSDIHKEPVEVKIFQGSSMGHSRCPGTWSGVNFKGQNSSSPFKSLSVITATSFFECGFAPSDSIELQTKNGSETIHLACKDPKAMTFSGNQDGLLNIGEPCASGWHECRSRLGCCRDKKN